MKYVCLGYYNEKAFIDLPKAEQDAMVQQCLAYDAVLKKGGHFVDGLALQGATSAVTVRWDRDKPRVTDGPYAETKEVLGGILLLEAQDLNQAIQLMSRHPGVRMGPFEIRPLDEVFTAHAKEGLPA